MFNEMFFTGFLLCCDGGLFQFPLPRSSLSCVPVTWFLVDVMHDLHYPLWMLELYVVEFSQLQSNLKLFLLKQLIQDVCVCLDD